jgi:hypothetical protein
MKHKIKRFFQKVGITFIKKTTPKEEYVKSEYEYECIGICKNLINKESTKLLISPISGKRYIKSYDDQIFIIMDKRVITIVNHNYSYTIELTPKTSDRLYNSFDNEVESRRKKMEDEIRSNVKHSLSNIFKNITNEQI